MYEAAAEYDELADVLPPLPDYAGVVLLAHRYRVPPWELFDPDETPPPRSWWRGRMSIVAEAMGIAERRQIERIERESRRR